MEYFKSNNGSSSNGCNLLHQRGSSDMLLCMITQIYNDNLTCATHRSLSQLGIIKYRDFYYRIKSIVLFHFAEKHRQAIFFLNTNSPHTLDLSLGEQLPHQLIPVCLTLEFVWKPRTFWLYEFFVTIYKMKSSYPNKLFLIVPHNHHTSYIWCHNPALTISDKIKLFT